MHLPIIALVQAAVSILGTVAKYTATTIDDQIYTVLNAALKDPALLDLLKLLIDDHDVTTLKDGARDAAMSAVMGKFDGSRIDAIKERLAAMGVTWEVVVKYLPLIIRLLLSISGKRS